MLAFRIYLTIAALLCATFAYVQVAQADAVCMTRQAIAEWLTNQHAEAPVSHATSKGHLVELWRSVENGTWTVVVHHPSGQSCAIFAGHDWTEGAAPSSFVGSPV